MRLPLKMERRPKIKIPRGIIHGAIFSIFIHCFLYCYLIALLLILVTKSITSLQFVRTCYFLGWTFFPLYMYGERVYNEAPHFIILEIYICCLWLFTWNMKVVEKTALKGDLNARSWSGILTALRGNQNARSLNRILLSLEEIKMIDPQVGCLL